MPISVRFSATKRNVAVPTIPPCSRINFVREIGNSSENNEKAAVSKEEMHPELSKLVR